MSRDLDEVIRTDPTVTPPSAASPHAFRPLALFVAGTLLIPAAAGVDALTDGSRVVGLPIALAGALILVGGVLLARNYEESATWLVRDFFRVGQTYRIAWGEPRLDRLTMVRVIGVGWVILGVGIVGVGIAQLVGRIFS